MSSLINKSFEELYNEECRYATTLKYSRSFKGYNANVRYNEHELKFRLSYRWKNISDDIKIGLIQSLLNKVFKTRNDSINIDMYNIFLKKVHISIPKTEKDPALSESFSRINEKYFSGMMLIPNLKWGSNSLSKIGSYDFGTDTVTISTVLIGQPDLIDFVMYHELLHKKLKFRQKNGKSFHHTKEFKKREKEYKDPEIEQKLRRHLRKHRARNILKFW